MMKSIFFGVVAIAVAFLSIYQETAHAEEQTGKLKYLSSPLELTH